MGLVGLQPCWAVLWDFNWFRSTQASTSLLGLFSPSVFDVNVVSHVKVGDRPLSLKLASRSLPQLYGRPSKLHLEKLDVKLSSRAHLQLDITTHRLNMDRNNRRDDRGGRRDEPRNQKPRYGMRTH